MCMGNFLNMKKLRMTQFNHALKMHSGEGESLYNYWFSLEPKFCKIEKWGALSNENC